MEMMSSILQDYYDWFRQSLVEQLCHEHYTFDNCNHSSLYANNSIPILLPQIQEIDSLESSSTLNNFRLSTAGIDSWTADGFIPEDWKEEWDRWTYFFQDEFWSQKPFPNAKAERVSIQVGGVTITIPAEGKIFGIPYEIGMQNVTYLDILIFFITLTISSSLVDINTPYSVLFSGDKITFFGILLYATLKYSEYFIDSLFDDEGKNEVLSAFGISGVRNLFGVHKSALYYSDKISDVSSKLGKENSDKLEYYGETFSDGAKKFGRQISSESKHLGGDISTGAKHIGGQIAESAKYAIDKLSDNFNRRSVGVKVMTSNDIYSSLKTIGSRVEKSIGSFGQRLEKSAEGIGKNLDPSSW